MTHMLVKMPEDFPTEFAMGIPSGRFAWTPEEGIALTFIWIRDYTSGRRNGQRRIRTQHGPNYEEAVTFYPNGNAALWKPQIADILIGVYCDPVTAARTYGRELGVCARCNAELTDRRSRHYGIGPECEGYWPWFTEAVDNELLGTYEELIASGQLVVS